MEINVDTWAKVGVKMKSRMIKKVNNFVKKQNPYIDDELCKSLTEQQNVLTDINLLGLRVKNEKKFNIQWACKIGDVCENTTFTKDDFFVIPPRPDRKSHNIPKLKSNYRGRASTDDRTHFIITNIKATGPKYGVGVWRPTVSNVRDILQSFGAIIMSGV